MQDNGDFVVHMGSLCFVDVIVCKATVQIL